MTKSSPPNPLAQTWESGLRASPLSRLREKGARGVGALIFLLLACAPATPTQTTLHLDASGARVTGLAPTVLEELSSEPSEARWREMFPVYVGSLPEPEAERAPILGTWKVEGHEVRFTPRLPFVPGQTYSARFAHPESGVRLEARFELPGLQVEPETEVLGLAPNLDEIPENTLRLYLHFSAPMTRGQAFRHVRLLSEEGDEVPAPFVAPDHELWNPEATRLTLLFDPGRIKRQVGPNLEVGPPLEAGRAYRLVVDRDWPDARGAPLLQGFETSLRVGSPDRTQPRPETWTLELPTGPDAPVSLRFPEPLDPALLERLLTVRSGESLVTGTPEVGAGGREWAFRPTQPWQPGDFAIRIDPALEDLAGNSLRRAFETSLDAPESLEPVHLSFSIPHNFSTVHDVQ